MLMNEEEIVWECFKKSEGKLRILVDENRLDQNLIKFLRKKFNVRMALKNKGLDDYNVYEQAMKESRVILTNDGDFWDDNKFPMHQTLGIIIVTAKDTKETITALEKFFNKLGEMSGMGRSCNYWWFGTKVKVQKTGFTWKYINEKGTISPDERIDYALPSNASNY